MYGPPFIFLRFDGFFYLVGKTGILSGKWRIKKAQIPGSIWSLPASGKAYTDRCGLVLLCTDKTVTRMVYTDELYLPEFLHCRS